MISSPRRAGVPSCAGLAEAVADRGMRRRDDVCRVALWLLDGGMTADPDVLLTVARDALFGADLATVARLARAALEAGAGAPAADILGRASDGVGDNEQAESVLAAAEALADDPADRALLALACADNLFRGLGRAAESEAVLVVAERAVSDPVLQARIAVAAGRAGFVRGPDSRRVWRSRCRCWSRPKASRSAKRRCRRRARCACSGAWTKRSRLGARTRGPAGTRSRRASAGDRGVPGVSLAVVARVRTSRGRGPDQPAWLRLLLARELPRWDRVVRVRARDGRALHGSARTGDAAGAARARSCSGSVPTLGARWALVLLALCRRAAGRRPRGRSGAGRLRRGAADADPRE